MGLYWWKLEIIVRTKVVAVKVVLFTLTQRVPPSQLDLSWPLMIQALS